MQPDWKMRVGFNKQKFPPPKQSYHDEAFIEGGDEGVEHHYENDGYDVDPCSPIGRGGLGLTSKKCFIFIIG